MCLLRILWRIAGRWKPGDTFLAYAGEKNDGRQFIPQAIAAGAMQCIMGSAEFPVESEWGIPALPVTELKQAGFIANYIYRGPSQIMDG